MKTILVTGGAGFIGSNFIRLMLDRRREYRIINADVLTYAGNLSNLKDIEGNPNYSFIRADIRDKNTIESIFKTHDIDTVVNFAAESHVDRSIVQPDIFLNTNILGTQVLLEAAKRHWKIAPDDKHSRDYRPGVRFLQISTDEVYGTLSDTGRFTEAMPLLPNNPYSASKAGADLLVRAYHQTYGLPVCITRSGNNYGPFQFPEKLIPLMIIGCMKNQLLPVYGDGLQTRDWLHVSDHCGAIDTVLHKGIDGEIYNISGHSEKTNIELVKMIVSALGRPEELIKHIEDRPGHDRSYALDDSKIRQTLGWSPEFTFELGIKETIEWYLTNPSWIDGIVSGDYTNYYNDMYPN